MSAWNVERTKYLVELYELQPCLYNVKSPLYHNKSARQRAIESIAGELNLKYKCSFTNDAVLKKINGLRTQYNEARKQKLPTGTGSDDEDRSEVNTKKTWWLYESLGFLEQHLQSRKPTSSIKRNQKADVPIASTSKEIMTQNVLTELLNTDNYEANIITEDNVYEDNTEVSELYVEGHTDNRIYQSTDDTEAAREDTPILRNKRKKKQKQSPESAITLIAKSANEAMAAVAQKEETYIEKSLKYIGCELQMIRNQNTVRTLIRNFIAMVQEAQDAEDQG